MEITYKMSASIIKGLAFMLALQVEKGPFMRMRGLFFFLHTEKKANSKKSSDAFLCKDIRREFDCMIFLFKIRDGICIFHQLKPFNFSH